MKNYLEVHYRVGASLGYEALHALALSLYNLLENLACELLALVVAYHGNLNLLFASEKLMIVHLAREESVGSRSHGFVDFNHCPLTVAQTGNAAFRLVELGVTGFRSVDVESGYFGLESGTGADKTTAANVITVHDAVGFWLNSTKAYDPRALVFGKGTDEDALLALHGWYRAAGRVPPADRPESRMRRQVVYSNHPRGKAEFDMSDAGGFNAAQGYLPFIQALGAKTIWMRPVTWPGPYVPDDLYRRARKTTC